MSLLQSRLAESAVAVTDLLDRLLPPVLPGASGALSHLMESQRYSALAGGKRLRPFLVIESAALFGVSQESALHAAAALEMVHCYSLIHDDLPAMDDSDLRRGRPSLHIAFDEATAILAGDALLTEAFAVLAMPACSPVAEIRLALIAGLAKAAGSAGMVGGQMIDLSPERRELDLAGITQLQELKTGALFGFALEAGAILGRAGEAERQALSRYASAIGLAFQVTDDLLDLLSSEEDLGKPTGQDDAVGKATFPGRLGLREAQEKAAELVEVALEALEPFGEKADLLGETARFILERKN